MTNNYIEKWKPIGEIPNQLYLKDLHDNEDGFRILLVGEDSDNILLIQFGAYLAYQFTDEASRLKSLNDNKILSTEWPLFKANSSSYIDWIAKEGYGIHRENGLCHYIITCGEGLIDVLSNKPPKVSWL